jgi:hypothetical protein
MEFIILLTLQVIIFYKLYQQDREIKFLFTALEDQAKHILETEKFKLQCVESLDRNIKITQSHVNRIDKQIDDIIGKMNIYPDEMKKIK